MAERTRLPSWGRLVGLSSAEAPHADVSRGSHLIGARYQILNQLARGGMGLVHRAIDRLTGRVVTLKRLHMGAASDAPGSAGLRRALAHEFRLLASLRHPNVITVLDYGLDDDHEPFLVMDLEEHARTIVEAGSDLPLAMQVDLLVQTLRALVYLHWVGIIHRDLKPDNILVVRGQVKVLDFGLSVASNALGDDINCAGTPAYMAPETLSGAPPSIQSDLYGFGMVAYELLAGRHPFDGLGATELYRSIAEVSLPRAQDTIDPRLRPLLARLLAKEPQARYATALEVIEALGTAIERSLVAETVATRESALQTAPLVGREAELEKLEGALQAAIRGNGSTWLVGGESGVGKSRVLDEFRTRALVEGAVVVRGQAIGQGGSPFHAWRDIVSDLLLRVTVTDPDAAVLRTVVPNISELLNRNLPSPPPIESEAAQTRLLCAVEEVFRLQPRPLVVILEDLQWAGSESLKLLAWLVQTAEKNEILLVGTFRDDEAPSLPEMIPGAHRIELRRLTRDEITILGEAMIGSSARRADVVELLERETEGIPFFVVEVVRALAEGSGALDRIGGARLPTRVVSGGMEKVIRRRLARVSPDTLLVLQTAAVCGRRIDPGLLRAVHPDLDVDKWIGACARSAILELRDQHWMFAHDKLREQLVDDLPAGARRGLHRGIGEAMEQLYADQADRLASLAHHWREAGDVQHETRYSLEAGMVALQTGACREAVEYLGRARDLVSMTNGALPVRRRSWRTFAFLDPNSGIDVVSAAFRLGQIEGALAEAFYRLGDLNSCREHGERAIEHFGQHVPSTNIGWLAAIVGQLIVRGLQAVSHFHAPAARSVAREVAHVQIRLTETFFYSLRLGPILWSSLRVVNQCAPVGQVAELAKAYVVLAHLAGSARIGRIADLWGRRALGIAEGSGVERDVAWIRSRRAVYLLGECRWSDAEAQLGQATSIAERVGDLRLWEESRAQLALVGFYRARFDEARAYFRDAHKLSRRTGNRQIECWAAMGEGAICSRLGQEVAAVQSLEAALEMMDEESLKAEAINGYGVLARAHLRAGDFSSAYEVANRAMSHIRNMKPVAYWTQPGLAGTAETFLRLVEADWAPTGQVRVNLPKLATQAVAAMGRFARHFPLGRPYAALWSGLAASLGGRRSRALRLWEHAIAIARQLGTPYERAWAHLEIARHLPIASLDRVRHFRESVHMFQQLGCETDLAWAREEMARGDTDRGTLCT